MGLKEYKEYPKVGDEVEFKGQDSYFKGVVVSVFNKLDGKSLRCVVQDDRGLLLIKNPKQAILVNKDVDPYLQTK